MTTPHDIPLQIISPNASSERRITPSWTIAHLKTKLESVTGIPPGSQRLLLKGVGGGGDGVDGGDRVIEAEDEESCVVGEWPLRRGGELVVQDTRPPTARPNLTDPSSVPKYEMPSSQYAALPDSVLAWKRAQKLGRFDPDAPSPAALAQKHTDIALSKGLKPGLRCRVSTGSTGGSGEKDKMEGRRGTIRFLGDVPEIAAREGEKGGGYWVGVELDEPVGRNDGGFGEGGKRYFVCGAKHGVFVRPERVEVGEWPVLGLGTEEEVEEEEEEI
ncbi:MAG: hypothetical protein M1824_003295 [Vezdaea acicularis]|nr:MAG: hypothetical protein M1824_003295 [Vezdaea acicularis]